MQLAYGYRLTTDPTFRDKENGLTPELKSRMEELFYLAMEGDYSDIETFLDLIDKYPQNPQLKNYLSSLYKNLGEWDKSIEINHQIVREHPDYLFGKLNMANEFIEQEEFERIPEILGEQLELKALYPKRQTFHLAELTGYLKMLVYYFSVIGDHDNAEKRLAMLEDIAPDHPDTEEAYLILNGDLNSDSFNIHDNVPAPISVEQTTKPPVFNHPEIEILYHNDLDISPEEINMLFDLPRETLIKDLEEILNDSMRRYLFYFEKDKQEELAFAIHAFFMLGDLEAMDSLPLLLKVLSQDEYFLDFWYSDLLVDSLWEPILKLSLFQLDTLKEFVTSPGIYTFSKTEVAAAVTQIALHFPERRNEVIEWYREVFNYFISVKIDDPSIDNEFIALMICEIIDLQEKELLPEIKQLFDREIVEIETSGTYKEVLRDINIKPLTVPLRKIMSVEERFAHITDSFNLSVNKAPSFPLFDDESDFLPPETYVRENPKIGRNDPCPCGSGKKYKKCCLNKDSY